MTRIVRAIGKLAAASIGLGLSCGLVEAASDNIQHVEIADPRPLSAWAQRLQEQFDVVITYEDQEYANRRDVLDVTASVAPGSAFAPEQHRVLIPRGGSVAVKVPALTSETSASQNDRLVAVRTSLNDVQSDLVTRGIGGRFDIRQDGDALHIVPHSMRDRAGKEKAAQPVLDVRVSLSTAKQSALAQIEGLCEVLSRVARKNVVLGTAPVNALARTQVALDAGSLPARDVLSRIIDQVPARLSWLLLYDPGLDWWVLNIQHVD